MSFEQHIMLFVLHMTLFAYHTMVILLYLHTFTLDSIKWPPCITERAAHIMQNVPCQLKYVPRIHENVKAFHTMWLKYLRQSRKAD